MKTELNKWAQEVIDYCNPIAKENNLEYYPFQSPVNIENTEILIVGVNPRGNGDYKCQSTKKEWEFKDGVMPIERLINGNPFYKNVEKWRFFNNLKQIPFLDNKLSENKFTYMNYFYFSTKDANEMKKINRFNEIKSFCVKKLIELIDILKPKIIIVLGVADGLDSITKNTTIVKRGSNRVLTKGILNGVTLYGIPHSSRNYPYDVRGVLDTYLNDIVDNKELKSHEIPYFGKVKRTINIEEINSKLENFDFKFQPFKNKDHIYEATFKGIKEDILDFRLDTKKYYFSFRSLEKINNNFFELEGKDIYQEIFKDCADFEKASWLVYEDLHIYGMGQSIEDKISDKLITLFNKISD